MVAKFVVAWLLVTPTRVDHEICTAGQEYYRLVIGWFSYAIALYNYVRYWKGRQKVIYPEQNTVISLQLLVCLCYGDILSTRHTWSLSLPRFIDVYYCSGTAYRKIHRPQLNTPEASDVHITLSINDALFDVIEAVFQPISGCRDACCWMSMYPTNPRNLGNLPALLYLDPFNGPPLYWTNYSWTGGLSKPLGIVLEVGNPSPQLHRSYYLMNSCSRVLCHLVFRPR